MGGITWSDAERVAVADALHADNCPEGAPSCYCDSWQREADLALATLAPHVAARVAEAERAGAARAWSEGWDVGLSYGIAYQAGQDGAYVPPRNPYRADAEGSR